MAFNANVYRVMIASPRDVQEEREIVRKLIYNWNAINSYDKGIVLLPVGWETHSAPKMGERPQEIINKQILENSDLLIGIFWTRIGTPTGESISGSVEEIEKHIESGKPAMLYFSSKPVIPDNIDQDQYNALKKFINDCYKKGLVENYDSLNEFEKKLNIQLSITINSDVFFEKKNNSSKLNNISYVENDEYDIVNELSSEAKELLIEGSKDNNGTIMKINSQRGFTIQTNRKMFNTKNDPRIKALWSQAFEQLVDNDLISDPEFTDMYFNLTIEGFKIADYLIKNESPTQK